MALETIEIGLFIPSASAGNTYLYNRSKFYLCLHLRPNLSASQLTTTWKMKSKQSINYEGI
jgi:hypothetical protein